MQIDCERVAIEKHYNASNCIFGAQLGLRCIVFKVKTLVIWLPSSEQSQNSLHLGKDERS